MSEVIGGNRIQVEVCIESVADAITAATAGADRLELCSALALGGLTPSIAMFAAMRKVELPTMVLIRPRPGGFCYSDDEIKVLEYQMYEALQSGATGIVTGVLTDAGEVDVARCRRLVRHAIGRPIVFHRAFDFTPNPLEAMEALIDLGFTRILTSGQRASASEGVDLIRKLRVYAAGRIEILPGGGINAGNVIDLLNRTGCDQIHASCREPRVDPSIRHRPNLPLASNGMKNPNQHGFTSEQKLRELIAAIQ